MLILEKAHKAKLKIKKAYRKYFTTEGRFTSVLPNKVYLKKVYKKTFGEELDLKNPKTFTEKLNWLKLYYVRPEYSIMVDKYKAREYISEKVGDEYLVPLLGVWDSPDEIDFNLLPDKFVLKCNHESGIIVCKDKSKFDIESTKSELASHLKRNYYKKHREMPYKYVPRKIICEKFMENTNGEPLFDYKFFCFSGEPRYIMVNSARFDDLKTDMYSTDWEWLEMQDGHYPIAGDKFQRPTQLDKMLEMAEKLSEGIPFLRVDFNVWDGKIFVGELTLYHSGGLEKFTTPPEYEEHYWDEKLGKELKLPKKHRRIK